MGVRLSDDNKGTAIQVFPLKKGFVNISTGSYDNADIVHCAEDGDILITWLDDTTDTVSCLAGDDFSIPHAKTVAITTGVFHLC